MSKIEDIVNLAGIAATKAFKVEKYFVHFFISNADLDCYTTDFIIESWFTPAILALKKQAEGGHVSHFEVEDIYHEHEDCRGVLFTVTAFIQNPKGT